MGWQNQFQPGVLEKIVAGLSYFTFGMAGLLYMLFSKGGQTQLFRFHMYQAVLLSIIAVLLQMVIGPVLGIGFNVLGAVSPEAVPAVAQTVGYIMDILGKTFYLLLLYGAVWAFMGKFAEVPFISAVVRQNMGARW